MSEKAEALFRSSCEFVAGAATLEAIPRASLPEIAFAGRSNVGKSSLINALVHRRRLARVSQTPGATRQINFFNLGGKLLLTDLPGYGYAKASKSLSRDWQNLIFAYLRGRPSLRRVVLLIDVRRGVMDTDNEAMDLLDEAAVSYLPVLTKTDTLSPGALKKAIEDCASAISRHVAAYPDILATSAEEGTGLDLLRHHIAALAA